ncbi:MAG: ribonuclease HI [Treponema sp.]
MIAEIEMYTDGACSQNPGPGGWAFAAIVKDSERPEGFELTRSSGGERNTTNNRMELLAVINALETYLADIHSTVSADTVISIHTDSQYVQQGISVWIKNWKKNGWKTASKQPVKNQDLWKKLDELARKCNPSWIWVKGHAGNKYNELCDTLAVAEAKSFSE